MYYIYTYVYIYTQSNLVLRILVHRKILQLGLSQVDVLISLQSTHGFEASMTPVDTNLSQVLPVLRGILKTEGSAFLVSPE